MAAAQVIARSVDYVPRPQFLAFHSRSKRWAAIVAHRRAGKTVACIMELLTRALATSKVDALYAYVAPYREQAKTAAWRYLKRFAIDVVRNPDTDMRESDLSVKLHNGSVIRLFGADNPNALRGMYLDGVIMDEYADMKPELWGEVVRPMLADRNGWAVFIGTPKGRNAFYKLIHGDEKTTGAVRDPEWYTLFLKASETGILPADELLKLKRTMSEPEYQQELEIDFDTAAVGAIYGREVTALNADQRVRNVPHDPLLPVHTVWDLGWNDKMAIALVQRTASEVRIIDYIEDSHRTLADYVADLSAHRYILGKDWIPHDGRAKDYKTGKSAEEILQGLGRAVEVIPQLDVEQGINAARLLFPRCYFDESKTQRLVHCLKRYRRAINSTTNEPGAPLHDEFSHGADCFRYLATCADQMNTNAPIGDPYAAFKRYG